MSKIINLDSAYVGFIFLVLTEILLVRVVTSSQIRRLEQEVKRRLDNDEVVELNLKEYGPLNIINKMGLSFIAASFILLLIACSELGISGITVQTYSTQDTIVSGGYFSLDAIRDSYYVLEYSPSPNNYISKWSTCVDYNNNGNSVVGHASLTSYKILENGLEFGHVVCSSEDDVVITNLRSQCHEDDGSFYRFNYEVTSIGDLIYDADFRYKGVFERGVAPRVQIRVGEIISGLECMGESGGPGKIFFIYSENIYAIIDDSWRIGNIKERWIVVTNTGTENDVNVSIGTETIQGDDISVVECEKGCFEAIVEWLISDGINADMDNVFSYLTIWYEGLNFGVKLNPTVPICDRNPHSDEGMSSTNWIVDNLPFKTSRCDDAIYRRYIPDGGKKNVTEISIWAICFIVVGSVLTFVYYLFSRNGGYDILTYEGISKVFYEDTNPGKTLKKGGALSVRCIDGKITAK